MRPSRSAASSSRPGPAKGNQLWLMDRRGGEAQQLTAITKQEIGGYLWSPDSKTLLLSLKPKDEPEAEEGKPIVEDLLFNNLIVQ